MKVEISNIYCYACEKQIVPYEQKEYVNGHILHSDCAKKEGSKLIRVAFGQILVTK